MLLLPVTGDEFLAKVPVGGVEDFHGAKVAEFENGKWKFVPENIAEGQPKGLFCAKSTIFETTQKKAVLQNNIP